MPERTWLEKLRTPRGWIVLVVVLGVAAVAFAVIIGTAWSPQNNSSSFELYKYLIQFLMITALGAVVALLVEEYRKIRERSHREREFAIDSIAAVLGRLAEIVRAAKRARALLRRRWLAGKPNRDEYFDAISELQDHKDELDRLWQELEVLAETLPRLGLEGAHKDVKEMEEYLGELVKESEKVAKEPDTEFDAHGSNIRKFRSFLARVADVDEQSSFWRFSNSYSKARRELIRALAHGRLGSSVRGDA